MLGADPLELIGGDLDHKPQLPILLTLTEDAAERDFARIDSQRLIESGESERYAVEMVRVLRTYLAATIPAALQSATTHELAASLQRLPVVPGQRLLGVLDATDLIKFARERSTAERAREIGAEARRIVADTNSALVAAAAAAAHPGVECVLADPIGIDILMAQLIDNRVTAAEQQGRPVEPAAAAPEAAGAH